MSVQWPACKNPDHKAFTLVELLVSMAVLTLLMLVLLGAVSQTSNIWRRTTGKIEQFRGARQGFEAMTRKLSQATLNTYWDYDNPNAPTKYQRQSELRFISGAAAEVFNKSDKVRPTHAIFFQAPLGFSQDSGTAIAGISQLENLLNTWGYYLEYTDDTAVRPDFINSILNIKPRYRFRLMELMEASQDMALYKYTSGQNATGTPSSRTYLTCNPTLTGLSIASGVTPRGGINGREWFTDALFSSAPPAHILAENIVALIILPRLSEGEKDPQTSQAFNAYDLAPRYSYDSTAGNSNPSLNPRNQLPPVVQVTMVAVDEASFKRLSPDTTAPDFGLATMFLNASNYDTDMAQLQANLLQHDYTTMVNGTSKTFTPTVSVGAPLNYRIFTSNVSIKGAKWSRAQTN